MRKLILPLLLVIPCLTYAISQQEMSRAMCKNLHINSKTTLQEVKDNCKILKEETSSKGIFEVTLNNDTTNSEIVCSFPDKASTAILSSCK